MLRIHGAAREAERQVRLLSEVFLTPEKRESEPVGVNVAAKKAIELVALARRTAGKTAEVDVSCDLRAGEAPLVEGDATELTEAIANLIQNAAEATSHGGKVEVTIRAEGNNVVVEVSDTGEGMTEEVRQRCLEPFFSTRGAGHSGMGLTYVVAATGRYGGTVDIRSTPGAGAKVVLSLPVYKSAKKPTSSRERRKHRTEQKAKILVVDDEECVRDILTKSLTMLGHKVETAAGGREGLKKGVEQAFDLVILDRAMPDMVGDEVAVGLRQKHPALPILLLTGMGDLMRREGDLPKSVDAVLSKPITLSELTRSVAEVLEKREQTTRL
ncbi:MAG: ATP-binding protein [Verrucomicrobiota bacterium]|nr:ATP-binding protein [Verrucomicrobiota bacterium]